KMFVRLFERYRIGHPDFGAMFQQLFDNAYRRRFTHVIGVRLKGQPPYRDDLSRYLPAKMRKDGSCKRRPLPLVYLFYGTDNFKLVLVLACRTFERVDVFGKTRASVSDPRKKELRSYPRIRRNASSHRIDISSHPVAKICNLIHERDFRCQKR